jgi:hypothetical protein
MRQNRRRKCSVKVLRENKRNGDEVELDARPHPRRCLSSNDKYRFLLRQKLSNFPDRMTQTGDISAKPAVEEPTMRGPNAKETTATSKSPKGKALKQTRRVAGSEATTKARQTKPTQVERQDQRSESSNSTST